ncbi:MAG TPA: YlbF family regulator [Verrucomicrobiae bacterium]|nr:YlbF family regulator [Verrucomicrobiae bacterium]
MQTQTQTDDLVHQKTLELCETIIQQPQFQSIRQRIDSFMGDAQAQQQYEAVNEKGRALHQKQHSGVSLTESEISGFEKLRDALLANPTAKGFIEAQQEMHHMQEEIGQYVGKTFALGRVPNESELADECCGGGEGGEGGGCGCHH